jgi:hypothetical protein
VPTFAKRSSTGSAQSCGIALLYADHGQVHHLMFRCAMCWGYNITDG